jgi:hypothetical protein
MVASSWHLDTLLLLELDAVALPPVNNGGGGYAEWKKCCDRNLSLLSFCQPISAQSAEAEIKSWPFERQAQYRAGRFLEELPNFVVSQVVIRSVRTAGKKDWQPQDELEIELTYSERTSERYQLLKINGHQTWQSYESVSGAISRGEFGGYIGALIDHCRRAFLSLRQNPQV